MTHAVLDHAVDKSFDPTHQRSKALIERRVLGGLRSCPIDLWGESRGRQRERVTYDPRQPFVEIILVRRLPKGLIPGAARSPNEARAAARISGEDRVEPVLKLADLLGIPALRRVEQPGRDIALRKVLQLHDLSAQSDVNRHDDLLDGAEPVSLVRAAVAGQIDQLIVAQEAPWLTADHLLVGWGRGTRTTPGIVDQHLNRRSVDHIEADDVAAPVAANFEGLCVEHEHILERLAQPGGEGLLAVGAAPELGQPLDAGARVRGRSAVVARLNDPVELFDLVLAGLDCQSRYVVAFSKRPQLVETDGLVAARRIDRVVADREIPQAHRLRLGWDQRVTGREDPLAGLEEDLARSTEVILFAPTAPAVGGERCPLSAGRWHGLFRTFVVGCGHRQYPPVSAARFQVFGAVQM